jgi:hypothetical protein
MGKKKKKKSSSSTQKKKKKTSSSNNLALTLDELDALQEKEDQKKAVVNTGDNNNNNNNNNKEGSNNQNTEKNRLQEWPRRRREDIERCESIVGGAKGGPWLSFSLAKAKWIQLSSNKALHQAFSANRGNTLESVRLWMQHAEQTLCKFIVLDLIMKDHGRVSQFHALGRGWVFILLARSTSGDRNFSKLKVWYESSTRVETDHEMDMKAASLDGPSRQQ